MPAKFFLPHALYRNDSYSMTMYAQRIYIFWSGRAYSLPVISSNITGNPVQGNNTIRNVNGGVVFG